MSIQLIRQTTDLKQAVLSLKIDFVSHPADSFGKYKIFCVKS